MQVGCCVRKFEVWSQVNGVSWCAYWNQSVVMFWTIGACVCMYVRWNARASRRLAVLCTLVGGEALLKPGSYSRVVVCVCIASGIQGSATVQRREEVESKVESR